MASKSCIILLSIFMVLLVSSSSAYPNKKSNNKKQYKPCKELSFYMHDILYNGHNMENSTSAIIAAPHGFNLTQLAEPISWFGDLVAFNNPLTLDNNLHSEPIGKAQGFYLYDSKIPYSAWHGFSFVLNTTDYKGSIDMVGANADILGQIVRNLSIVGGTGDFFMHRGIASLMSDDIQGEAYYRLKFDLKFYECW